MKWLNVEINKVAHVESGFGFPREYQGISDEEIPFFKVGDMNLPGNEKYMNTAINTISPVTLKKLNAKTFLKGTIIFPKIGAAIATNKKRILIRPSVVDNNIMGLIPNSYINELYLYYWMLMFDLRNVTNIGPVPSMRKSEVEKVLIPLPTLSEQKKIVEILDQADALRKKRAKADAKAARILPALFYKMFGDPFKNKDKTFQSLADCADIFMGQSPPGETYNREGNGLPFFQGKMEFGSVNPTVRQWCSSPTRIAEPGDVLLCVRAPVGPTNISDRKSAIGRGLAIIRPIPSKSTTEFLFYSLRAIEKEIARIAQGSTFTAIRRQDVEMIRIPKTGIRNQDLFSSKAKTIQGLLDKCTVSKMNIEKLFNVLLHRAFSGELTANWREVHMKQLLAEMETQAIALDEVVEQ